MPDPVTAALSPQALVSWRYQLTRELAEVEAALLRLPVGSYTGNDPAEVATVVGAGLPGVKYELDAKAEEQAREIAGDFFPKVFARRAGFEPVKSFADVVRAVLPKRAAARLLSLCGKSTAGKRAHLRWK